MASVRKWGKWFLLLVALVIAAQLATSFLVQTNRMRGYLIARLERSFGRPVEAGEFSIHILPVPELAVDGVTIGEDPAFGHEYFLRAERMTASFRWTGLLLGHFEFGTISLTHPSLILARNAQGQWNLEYWLPPVNGAKAPTGPQQSPLSVANRLQRVTFTDGRINFKLVDQKLPFSFINVSGNVEQVSPGRWQAKLEAQPWRTGIALQSTGTMYVRGDVAGTSARLQPAQFQLHWEKASVADIFRLLYGNDSGVRGEFALDGTASIGKEQPAAESATWGFQIQARAAQLHRSNLPERSDNPKLNLNLSGKWNNATAQAEVAQWTLEAPHSIAKGTASVETRADGAWKLQAESVQLESSDLLTWLRAFHGNVADELTYRQFFAGEVALHGWPLRVDELRVVSNGGSATVPGLNGPVQIGAVNGATTGARFVLEPVRVTLPAALTPKGKSAAPAPAEAAQVEAASAAKLKEKLRPLPLIANGVDLGVSEDFQQVSGALKVNGKLAQVRDLFTAAATLGWTLNAGWELTGPVSGTMDCEWNGLFANRHWNGELGLAGTQLQAAGLNLPVELRDARVSLKKGARSVTIGKAEAFGATWTGTIGESGFAGVEAMPDWEFKLHADHLNASELDRWFGPRARPGWLERMLPSLVGKGADTSNATELIRRIHAEGELSADTITIERIKMSKAHAQIALRNLEMDMTRAEAQWAGGSVKGKAHGVFTQTPKYQLEAQIDGASLAQMPWNAPWAERWGGSVSGNLRLTTAGVGRVALLEELAGSGEIRAKKLEFKGWDIPASLDAGTVKTGASHWNAGEGQFSLKSRTMQFDEFRLDGGRTQQALSGTVSFGQEVQFTFRDVRKGAASNEAGRTFLISGQMASPEVSLQGNPTPKPVH